jgi:MFS family permease
MSTTFNGSTPGLISHNTAFESSDAPRLTQIDEHRESCSTLSSETSTASSEAAELSSKEWMDKVTIETRHFHAGVDNIQEKDVETQPISSGTARPPLSRAPSSQWQAGPPASIYSAGEDVGYPEGGLRAWLVVFGSFCGMLASFGFMNTIGVFQTYLTQNQLKDYPESTIGWIFSFYVFLAFFGGLQIGPVFDAKGPFWLIVSGSVLLVAATMLIGLCSAYWHFVIVIGLMAGSGTSLIFTPAVSAVAHFFQAKRGMASGIAACGGSVGGVIFPLMLQALIPKIGFAWATRVMGFILAVLCMVAILLVRSRIPPKAGGSILPDFKILADPAFALATCGVFFMEFALFIPISYLASFVLETHMENASRFSFQLLAILNTGSTFGRWLPGVFADRIGRYNSMILMLGLCCLTTLVFWLPASLLPMTDGVAHPAVKPLTIVYALIFGFASGSNISLTPVCIGQLCDTSNYGRYYATCYTLVSFGTLTGIPIAGALLQACGGSYYGVVIFTGTSYIISFVSFVAARGLKAGWKVKVMF